MKHFVAWWEYMDNVDHLVQDCSISSALAMEILQSCTKSSMYSWLGPQWWLFWTDVPRIMSFTVLLKHGRPVAKCDPWIQQATQDPTMDGPFGDQWILCVLQKNFGRKVDRQLHRYHIHGLAQDCSIPIANAPERLQSCTKPSVLVSE